jgi:GH35 family endo-1,4-beta-xylanase
VWDAVERHKGTYNFTPFDGLFNQIRAARLDPIVILSYSNHLYSNDKSAFPRTAELRAAFVEYALAEVGHYKGRGIVWEIWNEPFHDFDKHSPTAAEYTSFVIQVSTAIKREHPLEQLSGVVIGVCACPCMPPRVLCRQLHLFPCCLF